MSKRSSISLNIFLHSRSQNWVFSLPETTNSALRETHRPLFPRSLRTLLSFAVVVRLFLFLFCLVFQPRKPAKRKKPCHTVNKSVNKNLRRVVEEAASQQSLRKEIVLYIRVRANVILVCLRCVF